VRFEGLSVTFPEKKLGEFSVNLKWLLDASCVASKRSLDAPGNCSVFLDIAGGNWLSVGDIVENSV
jgi:hypothetical protein